jgi:hypothetical protein
MDRRQGLPTGGNPWGGTALDGDLVVDPHPPDQILVVSMPRKTPNKHGWEHEKELSSAAKKPRGQQEK